MSNQPVTKTSEICLGRPDNFDGSASKASAWMDSVILYLMINDSVYDKDQKKIAFTLSFHERRLSHNLGLNLHIESSFTSHTHSRNLDQFSQQLQNFVHSHQCKKWGHHMAYHHNHLKESSIRGLYFRIQEPSCSQQNNPWRHSH